MKRLSVTFVLMLIQAEGAMRFTKVGICYLSNEGLILIGMNYVYILFIPHLITTKYELVH